jgi:hypothetical protein
MNSFRPEVYERLIAIARGGEIVERVHGFNIKPGPMVYQTCGDAADMVSLMEREHATLIGYSQGLENKIDCLESEIGWWREQMMKFKGVLDRIPARRKSERVLKGPPS